MAFGTSSKIFTSMITDALNNTAAIDLNTDTPKVALFDNTITPSQTVASASSAYGAGVWASGEAANGGWSTGGLALASITSSFSSNVYTFDAADTANGSAATIADTRGCLVYEDTLTTPVADQGLCYLAFGGLTAVTAGTLTIVYSASGIFALTL
jgi:hypothetical protein